MRTSRTTSGRRWRVVKSFPGVSLVCYVWRAYPDLMSRYGHGVLRNPDPRFIALQEFCKTRPELQASPIIHLVQQVRIAITVISHIILIYPHRRPRLPLTFSKSMERCVHSFANGVILLTLFWRRKILTRMLMQLQASPSTHGIILGPEDRYERLRVVPLRSDWVQVLHRYLRCFQR